MMSQSAIAGRCHEIVGQKFGQLTMLRQSNKRGDGNRLYGFFVCECGTEIELPISRVKSGIRSHCGCLANRAPNLKHGMRNSPEYRSWQAMKARCTDPGNKDYPRWGTRGITVCDEWIESFEAFYTHAGRRPTGTTLDRIDGRRGYEPGNVRWATPVEQSNNRIDNWHVQINGRDYTSVQQAADALGVSDMTIVRWCDGYVDKRRTHQPNGGLIPPRPNCKRWRDR